MNIRLNGTEQSVADGASVYTLVTQLTGRSIGPDGRAADGRKLGVEIGRASCRERVCQYM